jgi:hypothetical protein
MKRLAIPFGVYALTSYALLSFRPASMFDPKTGQPRPFGPDSSMGQTMLPWWLAAFLVAYMSQHFVPKQLPGYDIDDL